MHLENISLSTMDFIVSSLSRWVKRQRLPSEELLVMCYLKCKTAFQPKANNLLTYITMMYMVWNKS